MKTEPIILQPDIIKEVAELYHDMEAAYDATAKALDFSCSGCPDNCCDSYFLHHTYTEWAYLWHGLDALAKEQLQAIKAQAAQYIITSEKALGSGERPQIMCPLNTEGLCSLYPYRLMICRLHGVPATFTRPDGRRLEFPGCYRYQGHKASDRTAAPLDRTRYFQRMVELEIKVLGSKRMTAPRVKLTIAQMIAQGRPVL